MDEFRTFLMDIKGWAISFECETWEQAEQVAEHIGAELQGEYVGSVLFHGDPRRLLN